MRPFYVLLLCSLLFACDKDEVVPQTTEANGIDFSIESCGIAGQYLGTYEISGTGLNVVRDSVSILFTDSSFVEVPLSSNQGWPYICQGSYTCVTDSIHVLNACAFPANILDVQIFTGSYKLDVSSDSIYLERLLGTYPNNYQLYRYALELQ